MSLKDTFTAKAINQVVKDNGPRKKPYTVAKRGRCVRIHENGVTLIYRDRKNGDTERKLGEWGGSYGISCKDAEKEIERLQQESIATEQRKKLKQNTFRSVAERWMDKVGVKPHGKWTEKQREQIENKFRQHVYPHEFNGAKVGATDVRDLTQYHFVSIFEKLQKELNRKGKPKLETRNRIRQYSIRILDNAVFDRHHPKHPTGLEFNVANFNLEAAGLLASPGKKDKDRMIPMKLEKIPVFLKDLDSCKGDPITKLLIKFTMLTMTRPSEARMAMWDQINFRKKIWAIPGGDREDDLGNHMKMGFEHWVPLSRQALAVLNELRNITGKYPMLFPKLLPVSYYGGNKGLKEQELNPNRFDLSGHLSTNAPLDLMRDMGTSDKWKGRENPEGYKYHEHIHGFRKTASTFLHSYRDESDRKVFESIWVEEQLSHADQNIVRSTYIDWTPDLYWQQRKEMMQLYADTIMPQPNLSVVAA